MLVLLTTGTLTWVATGRALTPVESMRRRAETITAEDLAGRLPVPETQDELARLATTLNDLLARVDRSTRKERQFVADASHELRSPVATIRALLESDQLSPHPGGRDGLRDEILAETARLTAVVNDLLTLARGDARMPTKLAADRPDGPGHRRGTTSTDTASDDADRAPDSRSRATRTSSRSLSATCSTTPSGMPSGQSA